METVNIARSMGAKDVYVAVTHGVYTGPAIQRIAGLDVTQVASTNTVLVPDQKVDAANGKLAVLVADAIQSGQVVLMVTAHSEQQTSLAIDIIQSAVGAYQDEARRRGCAGH